MLGRKLLCSLCAWCFLWSLASARAFAGALDLVEVTVLGTHEDLERIRGALGPSDVAGVETRWRRRERWNARELLGDVDPRARVSCWIDLSTRGQATLYFAHAARERFLIRDVPLPEGLSDVGREALVQVLEMSVVALLEDDRFGLSRAETERALGQQREQRERAAPAEAGPAAPPPSRDVFLGGAAFYAARVYSSEVPVVHGPGIAAAWIAEGAAQRSAVWLSAQYELRQEFAADSIGLEWSTVVLRAGYELLGGGRSSWIRAGGRLAAGLDLIAMTPTRGGGAEPVTLTSERLSTALALSGALEACARAGSGLGACAQLSLDFYPTRVDYGLARSGVVTRVFTPYRLRPGLALALVLD